MRDLATWQSSRYGLGPRVGMPAGGDLSAALAADLAMPPASTAMLASASDGLVAIRLARELGRDKDARSDPDRPHPVRDILRADRIAVYADAIGAPLGFRERLVTFWANHFTVSIRQGGCAALAGAFRREAIAPFVTGRFSDMLLAVMRHPAMLRYLDNAGSVGPESVAGLRGHRGLNENLARECLELHTLGSDGGYSQADVTSFAAILTGWSVQDDTLPYGFRFRPRAHQPGSKLLLGRSFAEGEAGGIAALEMLAAHPATSRHVARKLACHFAGDDPTSAEVALLAGTFTRSGGDLGAVSLALLRLRPRPVAPTKLRSPQDLVIATFRALGLPAAGHPEAPAMAARLGQPLFQAPLPNGWPDRSAEWLGAEAMLQRVDFAWTVAGHADDGLDPGAVADAALGGMMRPATRLAVGGAGSRREALTLLLASAEFQRR